MNKMLFPLILGYVVGALGVYTVLIKTAAFTEDESVTYGRLDRRSQTAEVIELFDNETTRRAA